MIITPDGANSIIFILSAPSGGGKTSIAQTLISLDKKLSLSISYTTRTKRASEIDQKDYCFVDSEKFIQMKNTGDFLEHAQIYDNFYGTSKAQTQQKLNDGYDIIFDIDNQGREQLINNIADQIKIVTIFLLPPDLNTLKDRLLNRNQDSADTIEKRLESAKREMIQAKHYQHIIINDDFNNTVEKLQHIIIEARKSCGDGGHAPALQGENTNR